MAVDALTGEAFAAPAAWVNDDGPEHEPDSFEPVAVRPYFPSRWLYRTRGHRQGRRLAPAPVERVPRAREPRRRSVRSGRAKARAPGGESDPEPSDLGDWLARASLRMLAHERRRFGKGWRPAA
jgi:hypothetical protein